MSAVANVLRGLYRLARASPVIAALPAGTHRLIISPPTASSTSFPSPPCSTRRTISSPPDFEIGYVSSGRDLLQHTPSLPRAKKLVVFADPDYAHLPGSAPVPFARHS